MGPAFAVPVAPKATTERAITAAIAVIEMIFISSLHCVLDATLNMEIGERESDYRESNLG